MPGPASRGRGRRAVTLTGIAGSPGVAIGRTLVLDATRAFVPRRHVKKHQADEELGRFDVAVARAAEELTVVMEGAARRLGKAEASILEAYGLMLRDETLREEVERAIRIDLLCVEWAVERVIDAMAAQLGQAADPYLAERGHDLAFVAELLQRALGGRAPTARLPELTEPCILVARDLSPAETSTLSREKVLAIVTEGGTRTSHTAIVARALQIPAVVGLSSALTQIGNDERVLVDGHRGTVTLSPSRDLLAAATARAEQRLAFARDRAVDREHPATTRCGAAIEIRANIELPAEAHIALFEGARGIGLYRTEFLYVDRPAPPSEDEQLAVYRTVVEAVRPLPVTLRTFDIGGDKFASSFQAPPDMNPALGLRAVRLALSRPELFLAQLRAMVRASAHGPLRIMVPMIASVDELRRVRALLAQAVSEVDRAGHPRAPEIPLGIMVEVPSAAIMANELAVDAEFLSLGTNDLVQYALAVDRTSRSLAELASPFDPAILRLIRQVVEAGARRGRPVSVCGAMASDPVAALLLLGMGIRELSMEASAIPEIREAVSRVTLRETEAAALETLGLVTAQEIERALTDIFAPRLVDLLGPG